MSGFDKTAQSSLAGRVLVGRYRLLSLIARGGMAEVWEGYDGVLSRPVAIKVLRPDLAADDTFRERFRREAITAARLVHPGIVATFDTGVDDGLAFIVMELVRGRNLRQLLDAQGRLDAWRATSIASQIADALAHSHQAGLVHRDVKPANVLILEDGSLGPRVKVTDFGIAKAGMDAGADLTRTGMVLGTPKYLSPEQIRGIDPDPRADLYSLGVVLYEMLVGAPPFKGDNDMATALAHLSERVPKPSSSVKGIPAKLDRVVVDLMSKNPDRRVQTAAQARDRLNGLALPAAGLDPGRGAEPTRLLGRRRDHTLRPGLLDGTGATVGSGGRPGLAPPAPPTTGADGIAGVGQQHEPAARVDPGFDDATALQATDHTVGFADGDHTVGFAGRDHTVGFADGFADRDQAVRSADGAEAPDRPHPRRHLRSERAAGLVVLALVVVGIVVAATLASGGTKHHDSKDSTTSAGASVPIESVSVFMADDRPPDNPNDTSLAFDGNPATFWSTDQYRNPTFSGLYPGIGLSIKLRSAADLQTLAVTSATEGWAASVYVSSSPVASGQNVTAWGQPADSKSSIAGNAVLSLGGRKGQYVLLWITNLGPADQAELAELKVTATG